LIANWWINVLPKIISKIMEHLYLIKYDNGLSAIQKEIGNDQSSVVPEGKRKDSLRKTAFCVFKKMCHPTTVFYHCFKSGSK
jgi:hypothetical protein